MRRSLDDEHQLTKYLHRLVGYFFFMSKGFARLMVLRLYYVDFDVGEVGWVNWWIESG